MIESEFVLLLLTLLLGIAIVIAMVLKGLEAKLGILAIAAYLLLGLSMHLTDVMTLLTCIATPLCLRSMLHRWPVRRRLT
ncbi:MAG: hypothetical protein WBA57_27345 [Elainellaceae cyanobacterium]